MNKKSTTETQRTLRKTRNIIWLDNGDRLLCKTGDGYIRCVACDQPLEHSKTTLKVIHKCSERFLSGQAQKEAVAGEPIAQETPQPADCDFTDRLRDGFSMMKESN